MKTIILLYVIIAISCSKSVYSKAILSEFKVSAIHELLRKGGWNCTDVIDYFIKRAVTYNPIIKALISFNPKAHIEAYELDQFYHEKNRLKGQLHCIPLIIKDNIDVAGLPSTGGIKALRYSIPNSDAPVIDKLRREGAIIIAKANMAEMANGDMENSEMGGQCVNPFDLKRTCGSSSSGSCGGISSAMAIISLGSDTGGSILQPASFNGLFGMRTPVGYPKTEGVIPLFDNQDVVGPITKHLDDLVLAYSIMVDNKTIQENYMKQIEPSKLKLGYFTNFFNTFNVSSPTLKNKTYYLDPDIKEIMLNTMQKFKSLNINVIEKSLNQTELTELFDAIYRITDQDVQILCLASCAKSSLNNYFNDSSRFAVDAPYKNYDQLASSPLLTKTWVERFAQGNLLGAACSSNCQRYTQMIVSFKNTIDNWFSSNDVDAYIFPSFVHPPFLLVNDSNAADQNRITTVMSVSPLTFYPSITGPVGFSKPTIEQPDGLPVNVFLFSKPENFDKVFQIFKLFENLGKLDKLPSTTPLLVSNSDNGSIKQVCSIFTFVLSATISLTIKY